MSTTLDRLPAPLRRAATSAIGTYAAYVAHGLRHPGLLIPRASPLERRSRLPGDQLVDDPDWVTDFSTDISAAADEVWPWLVQIGYGRAGWYTWSPFDNGGVASADAIVPALQQLAVGDTIPDGPRAAEGVGAWQVTELRRGEALVLRSRRHPTTGREIAAGGPPPFVDCSWAFALVPYRARLTVLHVRVRAKLHAGRGSHTAARLARWLFGLGDNVMENTLLDGIRRRAERDARPPS